MDGGVLVVDDDDFTRLALAAVVASLGYEVLAQAGTVVEAMDAARTTRLDIALVDLDLGEGPTGIDLAHGLRTVQPAIGILVLSSYADPKFLGRRSRPLPDDAEFLTKQELGHLDVLRAALARAQGLDVSAPAPKRVGALPSLSESQIETMRLIAAGYSNAEIARRMWLTEPGVNRAVTRLVRQLGLDVTKERNPRVLIAKAYADLAGRTVVRE